MKWQPANDEGQASGYSDFQILQSDYTPTSLVREVLCIMVFELCCGTPCKKGSICSSSAALHEQHILVCHWITLLVRQCKPCAEVLDMQRTAALQCFFSMLQNQVYTLCRFDSVRNC